MPQTCRRPAQPRRPSAPFPCRIPGARTQFRYGSAQVADLLLAYDGNPAHGFLAMLDPASGLARRMTRARPVPLARGTIGGARAQGDARQRALIRRLEQLTGQKAALQPAV